MGIGQLKFILNEIKGRDHRQGGGGRQAGLLAGHAQGQGVH